ncbi:lipoate--protein ligase family protein [Syntrophomonas erecta subsp. sporosyntropha]
MDVYLLGEISWWESQCYYHALARLGREGIIICYPNSPYICLGMHDDLEQEIDQDYCAQQGLPLLRRETGGGVVYLDNNQLFYQVVLRRDNPLLPLRRDRFYQKALAPAIAVYRHMGLPAVYRAPADITISGAKCSGNGAGDIGEAAVLVGNLMINFDFATMCQVLKVPHETYRILLHKSMRKYMTTISDHLSSLPDQRQLSTWLVKEFNRIFGEINEVSNDEELIEEAYRCQQKLTSPEWLNLSGRRTPYRCIKIAEGIYLNHLVSQEGLDLMVLVREGRIDQVYMVQADKLWATAPGFKGQRWDADTIEGIRSAAVKVKYTRPVCLEY